MEDQTSFLVIECQSETTQTNHDYQRTTEDRLDGIASLYSIEKSNDNWNRISFPEIICRLGAKYVTKNIYAALEGVANDVYKRGGAAIILIIATNCTCADFESPLILLGRAALRINLMLEKMMRNHETSILWEIKGILAVGKNIPLQNLAIAHVYDMNELRMVSGGNVNLSITPDDEIIFDELDLEKIDSEELDLIDICSSELIPSVTNLTHKDYTTDTFVQHFNHALSSSSAINAKEAPLSNILKSVYQQHS